MKEEKLFENHRVNLNLSVDTIKKVKEYANSEGAEVIPLCVKIEEELSTLEKNDKEEMLAALGLEESGLDKLIKASYKLHF